MQDTRIRGRKKSKEESRITTRVFLLSWFSESRGKTKVDYYRSIDLALLSS